MSALSSQEWILIGFILATLIIIVFDLLRPDLTAILVLALLPLTGILTVQEAFSGFSRSVVITIIGLFIMTQALEDTGVVQWLAERLKEIGAGSEGRLILLFMSAGAGLSLIMNNIAAGAVLLPAAVQVGRESDVPPSKLLIPLSFGTLVGGMATYFTTANIILSSILHDQGQEPLGMLDFLPTGGIIMLAGLFFMWLVGRHLLPSRESVGHSATPYLLSRRLTEIYQIEEQLWEVRVLPSSRLVGLPLNRSEIGEELGLTVVAIWRGQQAILNPEPAEVIQADDYLVVLGRDDRVAQMADWGTTIGRLQNHSENGQNYFVDLAEVLVPHRSSVFGKTLAELNFRNRYHLTGVALWREGLSFRNDVGTIPLEPGDALLVVGTPNNIQALTKDRVFMVLESTHTARPPLPQKAGWALGITGLVLLISILEIIPTADAVMLGVAGLALTGCINLDNAYRGIGWRVIFLIAGLLPLSLAMIHTGLAAHVGDAIVAAVSPYGPLALVAALFLLTMALTQVIGGQVAALITGPIAVTAAIQSGMNAEAMAVAVAIACSAAFLTPIAHPVNILMMAPGNYTSRDFLGVGSGMAVVTLVTLLLAMRFIWGV